MTRFLYISPGPVPPDQDSTRDKFHFLSEVAEGDVLLPVWWASKNEAPLFLQQTFPTYRVGNFRYHLFLSRRFPQFLRRLATMLFYVGRGLRLHRRQRFDAIVTYGSNRPGLAGVILKWITGAKLIVEIPGVPENSFRYDELKPGKGAAVKRFVADRFLSLVGRSADCIRLLYPWQLERYPHLQKKKVAVFHDFVAVHKISPGQSEERFILTIGFPWYTKGADILIRAFRSIAPRFPEYRLKLMGYYPDRDFLNDLASGCPQIEFLDARPNEAAMKVMSACSVYVLASRTEGAPRVVQEAMAARKPVIASTVGGVPHYIRDNDNGLLFQSGNVEELATKLIILLNDQELQDRLARKGYEMVFSEWDEHSYVRSFHRMLQSLNNVEVNRCGDAQMAKS